MKDLYYKIWVDAILKIWKKPIWAKDWKWMTHAHITTFMAFHLMFFSAFIQSNIFDHYYYNLELTFFSNEILNNIIESIILFFIPPFLLNYFLIFKDKKYLILIEKYKNIKGHYFFSFLIGSFFYFIIIFIVGFVFFKD